MASPIHKLRVAEKEIARLKREPPKTVDTVLLEETIAGLKASESEVTRLQAVKSKLDQEVTDLHADLLDAQRSNSMGNVLLEKLRNDLRQSEDYCQRLEAELAKAEKVLARED